MRLSLLLSTLDAASIHQFLLPTSFPILLAVAILLGTLVILFFRSYISSSSPSPNLPQSSLPLTFRTHYNPKKSSSVTDSSDNTNTTTLPSTDFCIVGCGVAGAALASVLSRRGFTVRCIERSLTEPHRIVGELLQPGGIEKLKKLGLADSLDGFDAQCIKGYTVILEGKEISLPYPRLDDNNSSSARYTGRSFHHGRFIMALRKHVRMSSTELIEGDVKGLIEENGRITGVKFERNGINSVHVAPAAVTVVCDGCFSGLRNSLVENSSSKLSSFLGLILPDCTLPQPNTGHVILSNPTPILAYPISSNEVRMLIDFPDLLPSMTKDSNNESDLSKHLMKVVLPQLPECMHKSFENAVRNHSFSSMPNRSLTARPISKGGVLLIGDSVNMRHPLTGGGMTVAFTDCLSFASAIDRVTDVNNMSQIDSIIADHYQVRKQSVRVINILADALYSVFCLRFDDLRRACFAYLSYPLLYAGPVRLLSGISTSQSALITHFFSVAFFGMLYTLFPFPTPMAVIAAIQMLRHALQIILPLIVKENPYLPVKTVVRVLQLAFWV